MKQRRKKNLRGLILALAVAAVVAPAAQARLDSERSATDTTGTAASQYSPQALKALELRSEGMNRLYNSLKPVGPYALEIRSEGENKLSQTPVVPDGRAITARILSEHGTAPYAADVWTSVARPDDRAGIRGPGIQKPPVLASVGNDGFDWADAGIGAGSVLFVGLILASGFALTRREHHGEVAV